MIFLVQFGLNKDEQNFQRPQSSLALRVRALFTLLLVFEKFTRAKNHNIMALACAYLFQIALEMM